MPDTLLGAPSPRREDQRFLTGTGRYTADLALPGIAQAFILRAPHAHARIRGIDAGDARTRPGVLAILTAADLAADGIPEIPGGAEMTRPDGRKAPHTT